MPESRFFTDHWRDIDAKRIERYERMFVWREGHIALLAPLDLREGSRVLDYGCGPGFVSQGMGEIVASTGHVYGVDINARFVDDASSRAAAADNVSFHLLDGDRIPLADSSLDRVLCKNVLEYVPNVRKTIHEFIRVLEPGGRVLLIDSDWRFVAVEPWGAQRTRQFFDAAAIAFKEPEIGRKLRALLLESGFAEVDVTVQAGVDTEGGSLSVLRNMASYAREVDSGVDIDVDSMIEEAESAIANDRYLFCLPQFRVTGIKPSL